MSRLTAADCTWLPGCLAVRIDIRCCRVRVANVHSFCHFAGEHYNRQVLLPHPASTESLWLDSHVYDILVVIEFNTDTGEQIAPGAGSAIFLHVASDDFGPTAGCVALRQDALEEVLRRCSAETRILIRNAQQQQRRRRRRQPEQQAAGARAAAPPASL